MASRLRAGMDLTRSRQKPARGHRAPPQIRSPPPIPVADRQFLAQRREPEPVLAMTERVFAGVSREWRSPVRVQFPEDCPDRLGERN